MKSDKGAAFEREESRFLSLWWSGQQKDDIFWRNRTRITSKTINAERQCGDLQAFHTDGLPFAEVFNVELKAGYSTKKTDSTNKKVAAGKAIKKQTVRNVPWDLLSVIDSKTVDDNLVILNFWYQCESDAEKSGRIPLLIFKRDFHSPVVVIQPLDFREIENYAGILPGRSLSLVDRNIGLKLSLYRHEDFFEWLRPSAVLTFHELKREGK